MKFLVTFAVLFSFLAPAFGQPQERVKLTKANNRVSAAEGSGFWNRVRIATAGQTPMPGNETRAESAAPASVSPAPGVVEVMGPFDYDQAYVRVRFISEALPAGTVCVGWRLVMSVGAEFLDHEPLCNESDGKTHNIEVEMFNGPFELADWSGTYTYQVFVEVNGVMSQVNGYVVVNSPPQFTPTFTDASLLDTTLTVIGGPFNNPIVFYDGYFVRVTSITPTGLVGSSGWIPTNRLLTICDNGRCTTQVLYKVNK